MGMPPNLPPPPSGPPPYNPPPPSGTPPAYGAAPQWGPPPSYGYQGSPPPGYGYPRTEPFAVVSLVASLVGLFMWFVGPIVGIVFGHIARSRIKRSGANGGGLALAGLIIGYLELLLTIGGIAIIATVAVNASHHATSSARNLENHIEAVAARTDASPRDGTVVQQGIQEAGLTNRDIFVGSTGQFAVNATSEDLSLEGWRLEVHTGLFGVSCLYLPATVGGGAHISSGSCPPFFG